MLDNRRETRGSFVSCRHGCPGARPGLGELVETEATACVRGEGWALRLGAGQWQRVFWRWFPKQAPRLRCTASGEGGAAGPALAILSERNFYYNRKPETLKSICIIITGNVGLSKVYASILEMLGCSVGSVPA